MGISGSSVERQDAFGVATFDGEATMVGSLTLDGGQVEYQGATKNIDDTTYAITGGTGAYASASGTITLKPGKRGHVLVTVSIE